MSQFRVRLEDLLQLNTSFTNPQLLLIKLIINFTNPQLLLINLILAFSWVQADDSNQTNSKIFCRPQDSFRAFTGVGN